MDIFEAWELVEVDLHERFGIDLEALPDRSWRWLRVRIWGVIIDRSCRTHRATVKPPPTQQPQQPQTPGWR